MIDRNTDLTKLDPESREQMESIILNQTIDEYEVRLTSLEETSDDLDDVLDDMQANLRNEFKQLLAAQMIAIKEDNKPKQSLWNFLFNRK